MPPPRHVPSSAIAAFIEPARIDALLASWVPDAQDRAFVLRCLLQEGPAHHRGANFVLLALLGELLGAPPGPPDEARSAPVPMRLPPHLAADHDEADFPLRLPTAALERLAGGDARKLSAMIDCLTDGPPQHALANAAMVGLLEALFAQREAK